MNKISIHQHMLNQIIQHIQNAYVGFKNPIKTINEVEDIQATILKGQSRSIIFELFEDVAALIKATQSDYYRILRSQLKENNNEIIRCLAKKSHFASFRNQSLVLIKAIVNLDDLNCLSLPSVRFASHVSSLRKAIGLQPFELMQYMKFLDGLPNFQVGSQFMITIQSSGEIFTTQFQMVRVAIDRLLEHDLIQQELDLGITQLTS